MEEFKIGPWRCYDPRDDDWLCSYCDYNCPNGPRNCFRCHKPRLLTDEEKEQVQKSEHSGEVLCGKVMSGEFLHRNPDGMVEAFRQGYNIPSQIVIIGEKHYVLAAIRSKKDKKNVKWFFKENWKNQKEHTFPEPKPLNNITKEILENFQNE